MKSHVVRRGVLLAVHTGSLDVFTRTLPQVADPTHQPDRKPTTPAWKQIRDRQMGEKGRGKASNFTQKPAKGSKKSKLQLLCFKCSRSEGLCTCIQQESGFEPSTSDQQERDCIFTCKLFCCKCSFCHRVATKERRKSQLLLPSYKNKTCERCFLCRSLEFCKYCHKCPNCCHKSTCRGKVTAILGEVGSSGFKSKRNHNTERGLYPPLQVQTQPNQVTNGHKQLCVNPQRQSHLLEALYQLTNKNAVEPVANQNSLGFYNWLFLVPKPNNRWRPILDLSTLNTFLNTVVQNGDPRDNKDHC